MHAARGVARLKWNGGTTTQGERRVPNEVPIAIVYDASTYAVLMATPADLADFALGFSLTEGVLSGPDDIGGLDIVPQADGIELRIWLVASAAHAARDRRRRIVGPTGCGLCGIESLAQALTVVPAVSATREFAAADILTAMLSLRDRQPLGAETRAVHAAAYWTHASGIVTVREDVGRHNALDKLAGALACTTTDAAEGLLLLTSRVSVELVQKAARIGVGVLVAVSAPTLLAIKTADAACITLVAVAREDGFEVFTHPHRIKL